MISVNGIKIIPTIFPDKTSQVWQLPESLIHSLFQEVVCTVTWKFETENEFMHLAQLKTLLDLYCKHVNLKMPYLPYARQDKPVSNSASFALHTFSTLLNTLNFNEVRVLDAHSSKWAHLINRLVDESPELFIAKTFDAVRADSILFPDAGAYTRYNSYKLADSFYADKVREQGTGLIKSIVIHGDVKDAVMLIVDDLCDGGMTFKLVAEQALKAGAKEVHLYVTHGIFSKGLKTLRDSGIKRIFTVEYDGNANILTEHPGEVILNESQLITSN